jgi:hypothetical protein
MYGIPPEAYEGRNYWGSVGQDEEWEAYQFKKSTLILDHPRHVALVRVGVNMLGVLVLLVAAWTMRRRRKRTALSAIANASSLGSGWRWRWSRSCLPLGVTRRSIASSTRCPISQPFATRSNGFIRSNSP